MRILRCAGSTLIDGYSGLPVFMSSRNIRSRARCGTYSLAAIDHASRHRGQLKRCQSEQTLPDPCEQGFAKHPGLTDHSTLPRLGRDETGSLSGAIERQFGPQTEALGHLCDLVDPDLAGDLVEIDVTGFRDPRSRSTCPCPSRRQQWNRPSPTSICPEQKYLLRGVITPSSSAANATIILKVEPGAYSPAIALLISGARSLSASARHSAELDPR